MSLREVYLANCHEFISKGHVLLVQVLETCLAIMYN